MNSNNKNLTTSIVVHSDNKTSPIVISQSNPTLPNQFSGGSSGGYSLPNPISYFIKEIKNEDFFLEYLQSNDSDRLLIYYILYTFLGKDEDITKIIENNYDTLSKKTKSVLMYFKLKEK